MIVVKDQQLAKHVKGLRLNGHAPFTNKEEYWLPAMTNVDEDIPGIWPIKSTMNEAQGAIGSLIIERMDSLTDSRRSLSEFLGTKLKNQDELKFQDIHSETAHSHHLLPARCISDNWNRDDLIKILYNKFNIMCVIQYYPLNRYDLFKKNGMGNASVPNTDEFYDNMISIPFSLTFSEEENNYLVNSIKESIKELNK